MKIKELLSDEWLEAQNDKEWTEARNELHNAIEKLEFLESFGETLATWRDADRHTQVKVMTYLLAAWGCFIRDESYNVRNLLTEDTERSYSFVDGRWGK